MATETERWFVEKLNAARPSWQSLGACAGRLDLNWVPDPRRGDSSEQRAICTGCRVRDECLKFGSQTGSVGVFAGTTELERKALRKSREAQHAAA